MLFCCMDVVDCCFQNQDFQDWDDAGASLSPSPIKGEGDSEGWFGLVVCPVPVDSRLRGNDGVPNVNWRG